MAHDQSSQSLLMMVVDLGTGLGSTTACCMYPPTWRCVHMRAWEGREGRVGRKARRTFVTLPALSQLHEA
jgi:hypothetical protein